MADVLHMPSPLDRLATQIKHDLERCREGEEEWIAGAFDLCVHLAEARKSYKADIAFGEWCETNGFGKDVINHQTRAASIAMGRDPEALRKCLKATESRSLQLIYRNDFKRFTSVSKPARPQRKSRRKNTFDLNTTREVVRPLIMAGEPVGRGKIADLLGVNVSTVHMADLMERGRLEGIAEAKEIAPEEMTLPMRQRYEAALRKATKKIREELLVEVRTEVNAEFQIYLDHWKPRVARANRITESHRGVMSRKDFRIVLAGLHPDHNKFEQAAAAFELFKTLEPVLVRPETPDVAGPPLPATITEMMEAKRQAAMARKKR